MQDKGDTAAAVLQVGLIASTRHLAPHSQVEVARLATSAALGALSAFGFDSSGPALAQARASAAQALDLAMRNEEAAAILHIAIATQPLIATPSVWFTAQTSSRSVVCRLHVRATVARTGWIYMLPLTA